jgi:hypothetical protein
MVPKMGVKMRQPMTHIKSEFHAVSFGGSILHEWRTAFVSAPHSDNPYRCNRNGHGHC